MTWLTRAADAISDLFENLFGLVGKFLGNLIKETEQELKDLPEEVRDFLSKAALDAVKASQQTGGGAHDKLGAAVASVLSSLTGAGYKVGLHLIYKIVLNAVSGMRIEANANELAKPPVTE